jgi:serine/threonine-protein kinase RsbT
MTKMSLPIRDSSDLVVARRLVRTLGEKQGLAEAAVEALATAMTEIARNIIVHADEGELLIDSVTDEGRRGVVVVGQDVGPGICDVEQAMQDGYSTIASLGFGLPSAKRLVDEFHIQSTVGKGTTITLRKWSSPGAVTSTGR